MEEVRADQQELIKTLDVPKELQEFLEAGVQFGHKKSAVHPGMFRFIFGVRNNVHIIDVTKTKEQLEIALKFIDKLVADGKIILFVGTRLPIRDITRLTAENVGMPYVTEYWAGGTLTNWKNVQERVEYLKNLESKTKSEEWTKYTKHERLEMTREINKLEHKLGGIKNMAKRPDALFVADLQEDELSVREANKLGIPVIAIVDTNINPEHVEYPIPANDDAVSSVTFILKKVEEVMLKSTTRTRIVSSESATTRASSSVPTSPLVIEGHGVKLARPAGGASADTSKSNQKLAKRTSAKQSKTSKPKPKS